MASLLLEKKNPMKILKLLAAITTCSLSVAFYSCSNDDDDTDPSNPPTGGKVKITGLSHEYIFWGEELTISGTGFSDKKEENIITFVNSYPKTPGMKLTSDGGDIEIISASPTSIKIKVPYQTEPASGTTHFRGEDFAQIAVAVKTEKDTSEQVKFIGLPRVGTFEYHYGWYDLGGVTRSGDSVVIGGGFYGSLLGAGEAHAKQAGVYDKLRLHVDGISVPMKWRKISQSVSGFGIYLPASEFSEMNCEDGDNGWGDRAMEFKFSVEGTDIENTRTLYVTYLPENSIISASGVEEVSKLAGGNPFWTVTGDDMYFSHAVFHPTCGGNATNAEVEIASPGTINSEYQISVPLSLMVENCVYTIYLKTPCDETELIGDVWVKP
jgi:hypothetical protein